MSESSGLKDSPLKTRKRKKHPELYKRNFIKKFKLEGKWEHGERKLELNMEEN